MMINTNVAVEDGLCNGTRVQILRMHDNYLWCRFVTGARKGQEFPLTRFRFQEGGEERINQVGEFFGHVSSFHFLLDLC